MTIPEVPGTVLLFKKGNTEGLYIFLLSQVRKLAEAIAKNNYVAKLIVEKLAKMLIDQLCEKMWHNYIHAEMVFDAERQWIVAAWFNGVHIYTLDDAELINLRKAVDVYVPTVPIDQEKLKASVKKHWRKNYDFSSLIQNTIIELCAFGDAEREAEIENALSKYFDTPDKLICSELIARIYSELGYKIGRHAEFVTPDDIAQSGLFQKVQQAF